MNRLRADQLLVERGLAETRSQARALIMAGLVLSNGQRVEKAGQPLPPEADLHLKEDLSPYVSRGGWKLEGALDDFGLKVEGFRVLDVGASTGGFTDCLLTRGAREVVAVDVGYGLMHWRLRQDPRVKLVERTNARYLTAAQVGQDFDLAVMDVSFISLEHILPPAAALVRIEGKVLALVKPQFELGREKVGQGGVIRDPRLQIEAVDKVAAAAVKLGLRVLGRAPSRLAGPKGNQEYFLLLARPG
ncbi:MAG: TlyA family RNA methyltransferase [Pseudomonadota bacterium]